MPPVGPLVSMLPATARLANVRSGVELDAAGKPLGSMIAQACGGGSFDWKPITVGALTPAGATKVRVIAPGPGRDFNDERRARQDG